MAAPLDITGERYGSLVAISRAASAGKRTTWLFRCDCGAEVVRGLEPVRRGDTRSCGCLRIEVTRARSITHGHRTGRKSSRTLRAYYGALGRCYNPADEKYSQYGGRGIQVCEEWRQGFESFLADMGECPPQRSLDRVDVNKDYEPRNCRWATTMQQARSRTDNIIVKHNGRDLVLKDFARLMGVNYGPLHARVRYRGQDPHEAAKALIG